MPVDGRSNRKRPAARFNQFEQRSYDYDSMTLEFVRKLQKESQIKKSFTDNDILDISTKYYLLKPAKSDDLTLVLPKEDVAYDTEKKQYTVTLKDKDYHLLSESQFETGNAEAIASQIPVDKNKAAQYLDTLSERAMEKSKEALDKVKDILPESKGQVL
jgi:hypothetical protein